MWDLPRPGMEPMSPALASGFSTTGPLSPNMLSLSAPSNMICDCLELLYTLFIGKFDFHHQKTSVTLHIWITWSSSVVTRQSTFPISLPFPCCSVISHLYSWISALLWMLSSKKAGTIPGWYIIILQAPSTVLEECEHSVCWLDEMNALLNVSTSIISVGVKWNNLERILMKHKMVD